jgi:undecaprenyl-diphosphatase
MKHMQYLQALILGITQGLTEFIPVSSSGHLILVGHFINFKETGLAFDTALNVGTLTALMIYFYKDFWALFKSIFKRSDQTRLAWLLIIATIPAVIAGVLLEKTAETVFRSDYLVAANLILVALIMLWADRTSKRKYDIEHMTPPRAVKIGLAQAVALVPGVSRSGITISAGLFEGFDRVTATRFSFLLSAPVIAGATAKVMLKSENLHMLTSHTGLFLTGMLAALISGYWAIRFMLKYLQSHSLNIFIYYRIFAGVLVIAVSYWKR